LLSFALFAVAFATETFSSVRDTKKPLFLSPFYQFPTTNVKTKEHQGSNRKRASDKQTKGNKQKKTKEQRKRKNIKTILPTTDRQSRI
jgi:hypothetical protein